MAPLRRADQEQVDEAAAESFPASDPPAWTPTHAGGPTRAPVAPGGFIELRARLRGYVRDLAERFGERNDRTALAHARLREAAEYVASAFLDAGHAVTRYPFGAPEVENLEVEIPGSGASDEVVVVGANYDSCAGSPGADDNASGVAVLLALARVLGDRRFVRAVRLVAFANGRASRARLRDRESVGSRAYARRLAGDPARRIAGMIALQGLGAFMPPPRDFVAVIADRASRPMMRVVSAALGAASGLRVRAAALPPFFPIVRGSDHAPFWEIGARAVMVTDTGALRYAHYHARTDTPDRLDYERMAQAVTGLAAAVGRVAG